MLEWEGGDAEAFLTVLDVEGSECQASEYLFVGSVWTPLYEGNSNCRNQDHPSSVGQLSP